MPIVSCGIYLPNGIFLPNHGDGHCKNAKEFCEKNTKLNECMNQSYLNADEFLITAGCGIVASYSYMKERCFKVASNNPSIKIAKLIASYQKEKIKILPCWELDQKAYEILNEAIMDMNKMEVCVQAAGGKEMCLKLRNKRGFFWNKKWYPNGGNNATNGHEYNAMEIIREHEKLYPNEDWDWRSDCSAQDFLVLKKKAIQIGSSGNAKCVIFGRKFYHDDEIEKFKIVHGIEDYDVFPII